MSCRVYLTCPNGSGWIHKKTHFQIFKIITSSKYKIRHDAPTNSPYVDNLHRCIKDFLRNGDDFWLTMDADNPPIKNPLDLIKLDLDVIGFPTPVWHSVVKGDRPWYFNAMDAVPGGYKPHEKCDGLQEVDAVGSGCLLIARRVIEKLRWQQPFMRQWLLDGTVGIGGDFSFCEKAKSAGFKIWAHFDYLCQHFNELELLEVIQAFGNMYEAIETRNRNDTEEVT